MIDLRIKCNDCGDTGIRHQAGYQHPHTLRAELKRQGWQVGLPGGKDRCPSCIKILNLEKGKK